MKYDIRVKHYAMTNHGFNSNKMTELYFNSELKNITRAPNVIESAITRFENKIKTDFINKMQLKIENITKLQ